MRLLSLEELTTPDQRSLAFTPWGLSTMGLMKPELAAEFEQQSVASCELNPAVVEGTRNSFERLRTLHSYGILCYEAYTVARDLAWLVLEQAFRERFVSYYSGSIPMVNAKTDTENTITVSDFDQVFRAVNRGGSHSKGWKVRLLSTGEEIDFRGSLADLQKWARREGLLHGQRNKQWEVLQRDMRNSVAHPRYHVGMPSDSARTIHDVAEVINRLWGQATPGGRLYPAPLDREILVIGWTNGEFGLELIQMRGDQLPQFAKDGEWTFLVIRGVPDEEELWDFDTLFERTAFPCDLLCGPVTKDDALAWLAENDPVGDTVQYLDRLFALRIHEGRVSLPVRPDVVFELPSAWRAGEWRVVLADFPNDAFAHVRHIKDGVVCGDPSTTTRPLKNGVFVTAPPIPKCAVQDLLRGDWQSVVAQLGEQFQISGTTQPSRVRVPSRWPVAPDVEAG